MKIPTQKFFRGDLVNLVWQGKLVEAIVIGSYAEQYNEHWTKHSCEIFTLYILPDKNTVSWFNQKDLAFVSEDGWKKLPKKHIMRRNEEDKRARRREISEKR